MNIEEKIVCNKCQNLILNSTYKKNKGLCVPCFKKDNYQWFFDFTKISFLKLSIPFVIGLIDIPFLLILIHLTGPNIGYSIIIFYKIIFPLLSPFIFIQITPITFLGLMAGELIPIFIIMFGKTEGAIIAPIIFMALIPINILSVFLAIPGYIFITRKMTALELQNKMI